MKLQDTPIQQKLMTVILLTSGAVLLLTCAAFFVYEFFTFRQATIREVTILGEIIARNSTAALAFDDEEAASEILSALKAEPHIEAAVLYDSSGNLFSTYPANLKEKEFPQHPRENGYEFDSSYLAGFQAVIQGQKRMGSLYLKSNMIAMYERFQLYGVIVILVIAISFLLAYVLSKRLQETISAPILSLASTAKLISTGQDYAVRAQKWGDDELGLLTDAFNLMLTQIEKQTIALSESEERIRAVINSALSAVVVMDIHGNIMDWNARAEKMFGWPRAEALGKELANIIIPPNFQAAHREGLRHFLATGEGPVINQFIEISAVRRDGTEFPVELSISMLKTSSSVTFCGFITDITERKRSEEEIKVFSQQLEQMVLARTRELEMANKELEAFSYSVSHDLRAPLRSIHGYMSIFAEEYANKFDNEAKRLATIIMSNAQKMSRLIDDLLAFSQLGRKELAKTETSMGHMVETICEEQKRLEDGRNIHYIIHELPTAFADIITIRQVWTNLISNAVKYTRHKDMATIEIGYRMENNFQIFYVKDNGAGFDMQYYEKLFGVFQRLHSQKEFEGTGVGLAIVQRIVNKHGGSVWAEAKQNEGATFYFSLQTQS